MLVSIACNLQSSTSSVKVAAVEQFFCLLARMPHSCGDAGSVGFLEFSGDGIRHRTPLAGLRPGAVIGHGPFGHFFDAHFLQDFRLTHEILGSHIIREELGPLLKQVRTCPGGHRLADGEQIDPEQIAWLITRPTENDTADRPRWLGGKRDHK